ncbi:DUF3810 domain-containing protein [Christensenellaceae bacterium OttesenSCG-928-K19]|nr:DUF3810 domain-containing protein [Christensenellaceae bacterium OttesenSCG-928-K19]
MLKNEISKLQRQPPEFPDVNQVAEQPENAGAKKLSKAWKKQLWRLLWLLLFPLVFFIKEWAAANPDVIEQVYSGQVYPILSMIIGKLFGWMPFSFVEFVIYALLGLFFAWIIYTIVTAARKRLRAIKLVQTLITFAIIVAVAMNVFYGMWGFNYFRHSVAYSMGLELKEREPQELADLCVLLAGQANALRESQLEDENGVFVYAEGNAGILQKIPSAYSTLAEDHPEFKRMAVIPQPKTVAASELMSYAGISGIFIPFTEESNVNVHQTPLLAAVTGAHESAHFMGIAREDEANFLGYLACQYSDDPAVQYSGIMLALIHAGNALHRISPSAYSQLYSHYNDGVRRDLAAHNEYWAGYEGKMEETVTQMNDSYLKQQKQEDGVQSYGRMVDLLLAYYDR